MGRKLRGAYSVLSFDDRSRWNAHVVDFAEAAVGSTGNTAGVEVCGCRGGGALVVVDLVFVSLFGPQSMCMCVSFGMEFLTVA